MAKKTFDCVAFKTAVQEALRTETEDMSPKERREHFRRKAEQGPLGDWWKRVKNREIDTADTPAGTFPARSSVGA